MEEMDSSAGYMAIKEQEMSCFDRNLIFQNGEIG